jgi:hypothetical protein
MNKEKVLRVSVLGLWLGFLAATASAQTPWGSFTQLEYVSFVDESVANIEGFCYGGGFIYAMSHDGELIKIDPSGSVVSITALFTGYPPRYSYGAICYDNGTLWVVDSMNQILPYDTDGNSLGSGIDISGLPAPFNDQIWGAIKDTDGFWLYTFWEPNIFKVDMSGNLVKQFPSSWYNEGYTTIAKYGNKIYKFTWNYPASNNLWDYYEALAIDVETGYVTDSWDYPNDSPHPIGLTAGDNCFWTLDFDVFDNIIGIRKLSIPAPAPPPDIPSTTWGDFTIKRWGYPPVYPNEDNGLYGFDYDRNTDRIWIGEHYHSLWGIDDVGDRIFPIVGQWDCGYQTRTDDIATHGSDMWVALNVQMALTRVIRKIAIVDGTVMTLDEWPVGMGRVAGLATDGAHLWVSGRVDYQTTGDPMNSIYKFDLDGNLVAQFQYPETTSYDDLTWHRGGLWAISSKSFLTCEIHKLDPNTGEVLEAHDTGWVNLPTDNIKGVLASNGDSLLTFASLSMIQYSEYYQRSHLRLIEIQLPSDMVADKVDFNNDGQEDILWRYYGSGGYQGLNLVWLMSQLEGAGPAPLGSAQTAGEKTLPMGSILPSASKTVGSAGVKPGSLPANAKGSLKSFLSSGKMPALTARMTMRDPLEASSRKSTWDRDRIRGRNFQRMPTRKDAVVPGTLSSGTVKTASISLGTEVVFSQVLDTAWEIAGTGDFNSDGKTDILWRYYGTGAYQGLNDIWFMDGTTFVSEAVFSQVADTNWRIDGTGDFNGDGKTDILWRYYGTGAYQGLNDIWFMDGTTFVSEAVFSQVLDTNWKIAGTGDFNGDGKTDILWRNYGTGAYQGLNDIWFMDGTSFLSEAVFSQVTDTGWEIAGTGDFNNDGNTDILWRYYGPGAYQGLNDIWYMNGTTFVSEEVFSQVLDTNWRIVNR